MDSDDDFYSNTNKFKQCTKHNHKTECTVKTKNLSVLNSAQFGTASRPLNGPVEIFGGIITHGSIDIDVMVVTNSSGGAINVSVPNNITTVYVNPANGNINLNLSNGTLNEVLLVKDVSLINGNGSMFNVSISGSAIETYRSDGSLVASVGGTYVLNTSGGSVSFRYFNNTWIIENQFLGNQRLI